MKAGPGATPRTSTMGAGGGAGTRTRTAHAESDAETANASTPARRALAIVRRLPTPEDGRSSPGLTSAALGYCEGKYPAIVRAVRPSPFTSTRTVRNSSAGLFEGER
jgi:hypothetical protein